MAAAAAPLLEIKPEFGYVVATAVASFFIHHGVMATGVMKARKQHNVPYPHLYATPEITKGNQQAADAFNCVQRGHQNSLENQPAFLSLLLLAGVKYPVTAAIGGAVYLLGRILYFNGYATGDPKKRYQGSFMYLGLFTLIGTSIKFAYDLISTRFLA